MDLNKVKMGIAMPHTSMFYPKQFVDSFFAVKHPLYTVYLLPGTTGPIDAVRNELVAQAKMAELTHLFFLDTDQIYPPDIIIDLLNHDLDIVAGKVHRRKPPYDPILLRGEIDNFKVVPDSEWADGGLIEVDATGFGCVLVDMKVFNDIQPPWFKFDLYSKETPIGEDIYFYEQVKKAGYKVFVDCNVKIGHLHMFTITEETYFTFKYNTAWDKESPKGS